MGTRNLTIVLLDGTHKVAQYGQWDGYPSGQGATVLNFLKSLDEAGLAEFKEKVRKCRFIDSEYIKKAYQELGIEPKNGFINMEESDRFKAAHPQLDRDMAAEVLHAILSSDGLPLKDSFGFAGASLMCEYAYVVDLDAGVLEVYKGFNEQPLGSEDRFHSIPTDHHSYKQIKLAAKYYINDLPTVEQMANDIDPREVEA